MHAVDLVKTRLNGELVCSIIVGMSAHVYSSYIAILCCGRSSKLNSKYLEKNAFF